MTIKGIKCLKCNDIIYSRARHDFHWCCCKSVAIDGGFDYMAITGKKSDWEIVSVEIDATKEDLYNDWNLSKNKFGYGGKLVSIHE